MRTIDFTTKFKRDYKRESKGQYAQTFDASLRAAIALIASGSLLPPNLRDHPLSGNWVDHRDCHIKPDLVLIYRLIDPDILLLVRLGSHSELDL